MLTRPEVRPAPRYEVTGNEHREDDVGSSSLLPGSGKIAVCR